MSQPPSPILDYAGQTPRGRVRLPSTSRIVTTQSDGRMRVIETLKPDPFVWPALAFSVFVMVVMGFSATPSIMRTIRKGRLDGELVVLGLLLIVMGAMSLLVIHNTWRKTVLEADVSHFKLTFSSPFYFRYHKWDADFIIVMNLAEIGEDKYKQPLVELLIALRNGQEIRLFNGHVRDEVTSILVQLRAVLTGDVLPPPLPVASARPV